MKVSIEYDDEAVQAAIRSVKEADWEGFFETIRQVQYTQLRGGKPAVEIQASIKALDQVFAIFQKVIQKT